MALPPLTHLQASVLSLVGANQVSGKELRQRLSAEANTRLTGPAFYQAMARLEDAGFVNAHYEQRRVAGQLVRERVYRIRGHGSRALDATFDYYAKISAAAERLGVAHGS